MGYITGSVVTPERDDFTIWDHPGGLTFARDVVVTWEGDGFRLFRPGVTGYVLLLSDSTITLADSRRVSILPLIAALAREVDDGGPKRTWTRDDIAELMRDVPDVGTTFRAGHFWFSNKYGLHV